jgi:hypothetical protein
LVLMLLCGLFCGCSGGRNSVFATQASGKTYYVSQ